MAKSQLYSLTVGEVEHTLKVNDDDLESYQAQYGDRLKPKEKARKAVANKAAAAPANKSADATA